MAHLILADFDGAHHNYCLVFVVGHFAYFVSCVDSSVVAVAGQCAVAVVGSLVSLVV